MLLKEIINLQLLLASLTADCRFLTSFVCSARSAGGSDSRHPPTPPLESGDADSLAALSNDIPVRVCLHPQDDVHRPRGTAWAIMMTPRMAGADTGAGLVFLMLVQE